MENKNPSKIDCMAYIEQEMKDLDSETMINFGSMVYSAFPELVKVCPDGIRIHLNSINEEWIIKLYWFVRNSIEATERASQPISSS